MLEELGLSQDEFIDVCILCGCDYTPKISGIGAPVLGCASLRAYACWGGTCQWSCEMMHSFVHCCSWVYAVVRTPVRSLAIPVSLQTLSTLPCCYAGPTRALALIKKHGCIEKASIAHVAAVLGGLLLHS